MKKYFIIFTSTHIYTGKYSVINASNPYQAVETAYEHYSSLSWDHIRTDEKDIEGLELHETLTWKCSISPLEALDFRFAGKDKRI